jgi:GDP-mannose 6-dehydrogenase
MKISVFGIGYVGAVTAACAARDGHSVVAVDTNPIKVEAINAGRTPIMEPGLDELIAAEVAKGRLRASDDVAAAVANTDLSLLCVGTPSRENGAIDLSYVTAVAEQIGDALRKKPGFHSVVLRSTVLPGTTEEVVIPAIEWASSKKAGVDFGVGYYPEFLRESSAIADYDDPGTVVFGKIDDKTVEALQQLQFPHSKPFVVGIRIAEAVKYFNNAWHAVKISFANEAGLICKRLGVDSYSMMGILCSDSRLNISRSYLKPGFAFGGSCLPKDLRALRYRARQLDLTTPVLDGVAAANDAQIESAYRLIVQTGRRRVGLVGLSFKQDTDDLRESPMVILAERLLGRGYDVAVFDPNVRLSRLTGANLAYIKEHLPHIAQMLRENLDDVITASETLVIHHAALAAHLDPAILQQKHIVDLVRGYGNRWRSEGNYQGICW